MIKKESFILIIALFVCVFLCKDCNAAVDKYYIVATPKLTIEKGGKAKLLNYSGKNITWKSKDNSIVKINKKGRITAKKVGTTKIVSTNKKGKKYICKVTVKKKVVQATKENVTIDIKSVGDNVINFTVNNKSDQCLMVTEPIIKRLENNEWVSVARKEIPFVGPHVNISPCSIYEGNFYLSNYEIESGTYAIIYDNVRNGTTKSKKLDISPQGIFTIEQ